MIKKNKDLGAGKQVVGYLGHKCTRKCCERISITDGLVEYLCVFESTQAVAQFIRSHPEYRGIPPEPLTADSFMDTHVNGGVHYAFTVAAYDKVSSLMTTLSLEYGENFPPPRKADPNGGEWHVLVLASNEDNLGAVAGAVATAVATGSKLNIRKSSDHSLN